MKLMKYIFSLAICSIMLVSCGDLSEVNQDPGRLSDVALNLKLPAILADNAYNQGANQNRVAGMIMQQLLGIDAQQIQYYDYLLSENAFNNYWRFGLYAGPLRGAEVIIASSDENTTFYSGVAKVIEGNNLAIAASQFGDIPFTEAFQGEDNVLQPKYDTQESVYAAAIGLLDAGMKDLETGTGYFGGDLIYGGDAAAWSACALALKARYTNHLSKRNGTATADAAAMAQQAIDAGFTNASFAFGSAQTDNWTLAKFGIDRPSTLAFNPMFAQRLADKADPRAQFYTDANNEYFVLGNTDLVWAQDNAVVPMISLHELQFIIAEAAARSGDATATTDALKAAVASNMTLLGCSSDTIVAYADANLNVTGSAEALLEEVMNEAYVAYYGHNFNETWTNYRRTGYPALTPNPDAKPDFNESKIIPRRFLYVDSETSLNGASVKEARDRQNGGMLDADTWAFE